MNSVPSPGVLVGRALRRRSLALEPAAHPLFLHRYGEGFVEHRVALQIHDLVGKLVKHDARELGFRILNESREHRIAEPAERRIRGDAADVDIVSLFGERGRVPLRLLLGKAR
jgi:hypothetical protein